MGGYVCSLLADSRGRHGVDGHHDVSVSLMGDGERDALVAQPIPHRRKRNENAMAVLPSPWRRQCKPPEIAMARVISPVPTLDFSLMLAANANNQSPCTSLRSEASGSGSSCGDYSSRPDLSCRDIDSLSTMDSVEAEADQWFPNGGIAIVTFEN